MTFVLFGGSTDRFRRGGLPRFSRWAPNSQTLTERAVAMGSWAGPTVRGRDQQPPSPRRANENLPHHDGQVGRWVVR